MTVSQRWTSFMGLIFYVVALTGAAVVAHADARAPAPQITLLNARPMKLEAVLASFREQTHLDIQAEPCLRDRIVMVAFDGLPLAAALYTLAELNNWRLTDTQGDHYRLARHTIPPVSDVANLQKAARNAIPLDVQAYAGYQDSLIYDVTKDFPDFYSYGRGVQQTPPPPNPETLRKGHVLAIQEQLFADVKEKIGIDKPCPYPKLTDRQKAALLHLIVVSHGENTWRDSLLTLPMSPNLLDPRKTVLLMNGPVLSHGYMTKSDRGADVFVGDGSRLDQ